MTTQYGPDIALIVVDVHNDFADPKGSLYVRGGEEVVPVAEAIRAVHITPGDGERMLSELAAAGVEVI
jgi:nicotinamidase/pyrazinamidase